MICIDLSKGEILDVAARMMAARGFDGTTISALAKESGLPASSIYWHFSSKIGVLNAVMERGGEHFFASTTLPEMPASTTRLDRMVRVLDLAADAIEEHPEFLRLLMLLVLSAPNGQVNESAARLRERGRERLHESIEFAYADVGEAKAKDVADELADFALAAFDGAFLASQTGPDTSRQTMRRLAQVIVDQGDRIVGRQAAVSEAPALQTARPVKE